jgi:hypothetical protein
VLGASELVPQSALAARGWTGEGGGRGGYAQVVEGGSLPHLHADAYARQITDSLGNVLPNQVVLRPHVSKDSAERIDPLGVVVGLSLASSLSRPTPAVVVVPGPGGSGGDSGSEAEPALSVFPNALPDLVRDTAAGKLKLAFDAALGSVTADQATDPTLQGLVNVNGQPLTAAEIPIAIVSFNLDGTTTMVGQRDTQMFFSGSLLKIAAMYAAFQLRHAVNALAATLPPNLTEAQFFNQVRNTFDPQIRNAVPLLTRRGFHQVPKYETIFTATQSAIGIYTVEFRSSPDCRLDFKRHLIEMVVNSHNPSAGLCIQALGYNCINGILEKGGFFRHDDNGMWLAGDYLPGRLDPLDRDPDVQEVITLGLRGGNVVTIGSENDGQVKQVTTCVDAAKMFVLLANDELVSTTYGQPNQDMLKMVKAGVHGMGAPSRFETFAMPKPKFRVLQSKIGLGELKGGSCITQHRCVTSEVNIVEHASGRQFVTVFQNLNEATAGHFHLVAEIIQRTMDNFLR